MRTELGFHPRYSTAEAFADFGADIAGPGSPLSRALGRLSTAMDVDVPAPRSGAEAYDGAGPA